jgi:hypothetical protein
LHDFSGVLRINSQSIEPHSEEVAFLFFGRDLVVAEEEVI